MDKPPKKHQPTEFSEPDPNDTDRNNLPGNSPDPSEDDLDFVVTEEDVHSPQFLDSAERPSKAHSRDDELGIESTADLMEQEAANNSRDEFDFGERPGPLDSSNDSSFGSLPTTGPSGKDEIVGFTTDNSKPPDEPDRIERLTEDQIKAISQNLYQRQSSEPANYLSDDEKLKLIKNLESASPSESEGHKGFNNAPIDPRKLKAESQEAAKPSYNPAPPPQPPSPPTPQADLAEPKMARRIRGLAYFHKNFIQITGEQELREDDELTVAGREYVLRRKQLSNRMLISIVAPIAAVIIFLIGAYFSSDAYTGEGSIAGIALDENSMPIITGAYVRLPQIGKSYETNAQGFFKTDPIESGSQKVEYVVDGRVVATDYATVVDGKLTMITLRPSDDVIAAAMSTGGQSAQQASSAGSQSSNTQTSKSSSAGDSKSSSSSSKKSSSASSGSSSSKYAKLELAANVDGAKLTLDGKVLGAGNLTYTKLSPGSYKYSVSRDGYVAVSGTVKLSAGRTETLKISLSPASSAQKQQEYSAQDYYHSAVALMGQGDYASAVTDFGNAVKLNPAYASAYLQRADAYLGLRFSDSAYADLIRAAEIMTVKRDHTGAFAAFKKAIELEPKQVTAYLGRGQLYLSRGEEIAAITDFDMAIRIDKRSFQGYMGLGEARYNQGYFSKAAKHFRDARTIDPNNPQVHQYLMLSYLGDGDYKQVKRAYDDYLEYASAAEIQKLRSDPQYGALFKVVDSN